MPAGIVLPLRGNSPSAHIGPPGFGGSPAMAVGADLCVRPPVSGPGPCQAVGAAICRPEIQLGCQLGNAPPIFFLRHQKENVPRPVEKKKCFGGSVCAHANLLPPAKESWRSRAAVRDGNAPYLGNPLARGIPGYSLRLSPLPLPWQSGVAQSIVRRGRCLHRPVAEAPSTAKSAEAEREAAQCNDHLVEVSNAGTGQQLGNRGRE